MKRRQFIKSMATSICGLPVFSLSTRKRANRCFDDGTLKAMNLGIMEQTEVRRQSAIPDKTYLEICRHLYFENPGAIIFQRIDPKWHRSPICEWRGGPIVAVSGPFYREFGIYLADLPWPLQYLAYDSIFDHHYLIRKN